MNRVKKLARLQTLLQRLNNNEQVSNRDLKLVLTDIEFKEMKENWNSIQLQKKLDKPKQIREYEKRLKRATLFQNRYESYQAKFNKKLEIEKSLINRAEHELEKTAEYFFDITYNNRFIGWFDRSINKEDVLALENMPRTITSNSLFAESKQITNTISIRNLKIQTVEKAIDQIDSPPKDDELIDEWDETKKLIDELKSLSRKKRKIDI